MRFFSFEDKNYLRQHAGDPPRGLDLPGWAAVHSPEQWPGVRQRNNALLSGKSVQDGAAFQTPFTHFL